MIDIVNYSRAVSNTSQPRNTANGLLLPLSKELRSISQDSVQASYVRGTTLLILSLTRVINCWAAKVEWVISVHSDKSSTTLNSILSIIFLHEAKISIAPGLETRVAAMLTRLHVLRWSYLPFRLPTVEHESLHRFAHGCKGTRKFVEGHRSKSRSRSWC